MKTRRARFGAMDFQQGRMRGPLRRRQGRYWHREILAQICPRRLDKINDLFAVATGDETALA